MAHIFFFFFGKIIHYEISWRYVKEFSSCRSCRQILISAPQGCSCTLKRATVLLLAAKAKFCFYIVCPTLREEQIEGDWEHGTEKVFVTKNWRKLHNEELPKFYLSSNTVRNIKSKCTRLGWHMGKWGNTKIVTSKS